MKPPAPVSFLAAPSSEGALARCSLLARETEHRSAANATHSGKHEGQQSTAQDSATLPLEAYKTVVKSLGVCTTLPAMGYVTIADVKRVKQIFLFKVHLK